MTPAVNLGTKSDCLHLKVNVKKKISVLLYSPKDPSEIFKTFLFKFFSFYLIPVSTTPVIHLGLRISSRVFEKNRNGPYGILRGLGKTDSCKKPEVENLVALSLNVGR